MPRLSPKIFISLFPESIYIAGKTVRNVGFRFFCFVRYSTQASPWFVAETSHENEKFTIIIQNSIQHLFQLPISVKLMRSCGENNVCNPIFVMKSANVRLQHNNRCQTLPLNLCMHAPILLLLLLLSLCDVLPSFPPLETQQK